MDSANQMINKTQPPVEQSDFADYNPAKRTLDWTIKNFRGGQNRTVEFSLTFKDGVVIDEVLFKQLSPFTVEFDIPNHTVSGVKINKMDVKV